ncbi:MAG: UDP-galactopyranose mutase [Bacteroidales bacterium]
MYKYDYLIVGAGLFGSVFANRMKSKGKKCLIIEKRPHIGGNIYCENIDGLNVHKYGAHIFHTDNQNVWNYLNNFVSFNRYTNSPLAKYKDKLYNLPFNMNTFYQLWKVKTPEEAKLKISEQRGEYADIVEPENLEEQALKLCGKDIYHTFIKGYTEKQWGRSAKELPAFIIKRIPLRFVYDNNYFNDKYQGIPIGGYNVLINKLLEGIEVKLNINYLEDKTYWDNIAEHVLYTGCIDEFFDYREGKLDYRSLSFKNERLDCEDFQGNAVVNYNEKEVPFTRIIEHKHFENANVPFTIITKEYPKEFTPSDEPYYPINDEKNISIFRSYKELVSRINEGFNKFLFGGRLAQYSYFDMDDTVEAALNLAGLMN